MILYYFLKKYAQMPRVPLKKEKQN